MKFKRKTSKSAKKRFKITATGRVIRRGTAINHFNAKDNGNRRRHKRDTKSLSRIDGKKLNQILPYNWTIK
jgi:large subunit ribosomal protein L35